MACNGLATAVVGYPLAPQISPGSLPQTRCARIRPPNLGDEEQSTTLMGQWYATAMFWKPQVALFVNEPTLLPVLRSATGTRSDFAGQVPAASRRGTRRPPNPAGGH